MTRPGHCGAVQDPTTAGSAAPRERVPPADDSAEWLSPLRASGEQREAAIARLHGLLLRASRFEAARRRSHLAVGTQELDDLAVQAADDALVAVLDRLDSFRGASRFTTWAYKFAIYETSVKLRRRAWRDREVSLEPETWAVVPDGGRGPQQEAEHAELVRAVGEGIDTALTPHQRRVLVALTLNGVPIDVLADRLGTTRGALYKTLHDARRKLRAHLADRGLGPATTVPHEEAE
ncbi:MAG: sigma-70 family RNA polymerase sigma factor [Actinomycetota bacterium]|nr:sigma-70 family RNA polymerase sigma factor [Actinomycetota bacterium]